MVLVARRGKHYVFSIFVEFESDGVRGPVRRVEL